MSQIILVVDDEPKIRDLLQAFLEAQGYRVLTAGDGLEGWSAADAGRPDLVLTDLLLPKLNGFKLCQRIKASEHLAAVPVILLTGVYKRDFYRTEARQAGADDYVLKPVDLDTLLAVIHRHLPPGEGRPIEKTEAPENEPASEDPAKPPAREDPPEAAPTVDPAAALAAFQEKMAELRRGFVEGIPHRLDEIEEGWRALAGGPFEAEPAAVLHRQVHSLAGSSGTFGLSALGAAAKEFELLLDGIIRSANPPDEAAVASAEAMQEALRRLAEQPGPPPPRPEGVLQGSLPPPPGVTRKDKTIFVVDDDAEFAGSLAAQIGHFGYGVRVFSGPAELREALETQTPSAILMDVVFSEGRAEGPGVIADIESGRAIPIPVVFVSLRADFDTRLQAARAGGLAYLTKPVDAGELVERLDGLTNPVPPEPFRVLIVDDEVQVAERNALLLRQAGMVVETVNDPARVLLVMADSRPEIVLMDLYMPGCTGLELAAVIRQHREYLAVPIVFLSMESRLHHQMQALGLGADDFLTKTISPEHLVASVAARAQRARELRGQMTKDGLTGLLNHTNLKERLAVEVTRSVRHRKPLSFAMIDLDGFKTVNDTHGHLTGDRVLKSLSHLLAQRLRRTDILGRYGGDEFAAILPETHGKDAATVLESVRTAFARVVHAAEGGSFACTLSAGVASLAEGMDAPALGETADRALYAAKEAGRNRVVLDPGPLPEAELDGAEPEP